MMLICGRPSLVFPAGWKVSLTSPAVMRAELFANIMFDIASWESLIRTSSAMVAVTVSPRSVLLPRKYRLESNWLQVLVVAIRLERMSRSGSVVVELAAQPAR